MATYINGTDFLMFEQTTGDTYNLIGGATSHSLEVSGDILEAPSKDSGQWLDKVYGRSNWTASMDGLVTFDDEKYNYDYLLNKKINQEDLTVVFALNNGDNEPDTTKKYYKGTALIESVSLTAPDADNTTYSVSLQGSGALEAPES
ncbi:MAG: phage tail tube protein [bacterium]